jgi:hypothetical protein
MNVRVFHSQAQKGEWWQMKSVPRIGEKVMHDRGNGPRPVQVLDVIWDQTGNANIYLQG